MSDPDFKIWFEDVQWQVDQLRSTPSGDELIRALAANYGLPDKTGQPLEENNWMSRESGHTAADISDVRVIVFPSDKRSHSVPMQRTNALGGEGTDSYLRYNPRQISALWDASGKFVTQHPTVALGHELIHALHASVGANPIDSTPLSTPLDTSAKGSGYTYKDAQIPLEELFTTGTPLDEAAAWRGLQIKKKFGLRLPPEDPDYSSSESESSESDTMARPMVGNPYLQNAVNEVEAHRITWHSEQAEWIVAHPDEAAKIEMRLNDIVTGRARVSLTNPTEQKIAEQLGFPTRERYLGSMVKALPGWSKPVNAIRYDLTAGTRPRDLTKEDLSDPQHSARLTMAATSRTECGVFAEGEDSADCVLTGDAPNAADPAKVRAEQAYLVRFSEKLAKIPATSALATIDEQVRPALPGILKDVSDTAIAKITDPIIRSQAEGIIRLDPASAPDGWEDRLKGIIGGEAGASALAYGAVFLAMGITNGSINTTNWYEVIGNFEPHIATALALYNVIRASTASHPDPYTIAQTVVQLVAAFSLLLAPVEIGVFFIIPAAMMITSVIDYYNADKQDVVTVHNLRDYRDKVWTKVLENVLGPAAKQYVTAYAAAYRTNLAISEIAYQYDVTHRQRTALEQANANPLQAGTILDTAQQTITAERDTLTAIYQHARDLLTSPVSSEANPWHTTTVTTLESPTTVATLTKTLFTQAWPSFNQAIKARHHADEKDCSETPGDYGYDDCLKGKPPRGDRAEYDRNVDTLATTNPADHTHDHISALVTQALDTAKKPYLEFRAVNYTHDGALHATLPHPVFTLPTNTTNKILSPAPTRIISPYMKIYGLSTPGNTVTITLTDITTHATHTVCTTTTHPSGYWECAPTTPYPQGTWTITITNGTNTLATYPHTEIAGAPAWAWLGHTTSDQGRTTITDQTNTTFRHKSTVIPPKGHSDPSTDGLLILTPLTGTSTPGDTIALTIRCNAIDITTSTFAANSTNDSTITTATTQTNGTYTTPTIGLVNVPTHATCNLTAENQTNHDQAFTKFTTHTLEPFPTNTTPPTDPWPPSDPWPH